MNFCGNTDGKVRRKHKSSVCISKRAFICLNIIYYTSIVPIMLILMPAYIFETGLVFF